VAPPHATLVDVSAEELHTGLLQLRHGSGQILDHEADHRAGGEVLVVLIAGPDTSNLSPEGRSKAARSRSWCATVSPSTAVRKSTMAP
jgi:hypothetical protein